MASRGWVDCHGHFSLPLTDEEHKQQIQARHDAKFMVPVDWKWSMDDTLAYLDKAGIQMQMLSYIPPDLDKLKEANNYAAELVRKHPTRFGQLAALPTNDPEAALAELDRARSELKSDGFALSAVYRGVSLGDDRLEAVWRKLNELKATAHIHPNAFTGPTDGRPAPLIEVAFETTRVVVDMLYKGVFRRYPDIKFILGHCGGALPTLSGRLALLGTEAWVPNPQKITKQEMKEQLSRLYVDTAATAETGLQPALRMVGADHVVYGADCGVPCSTAETMEENRNALLHEAEGQGLERDQIGENAWRLFPTAAERVDNRS